PDVDEVERYITERLLIAGSDQPNIFTPGAIDLIYQCSEGIPRQINNLCDNSLIAAYAAGEQVIGRQIIEDVADNLDLLPRREMLKATEKLVENVQSARVLTAEAREELWKNQTRVEPTNTKKFQSEISNGNGSGNGNSNGNGKSKPIPKPFDDLDDEINLEIEEVGGFY
ncbi:MAG TPA: hypothetical protein PKE69_23465, partial [Pyrinomonadaceae bacterium]|nr:hypothetical protein [Pyrinomonadaceae bacterium]